ncbi:TetR family transcriptional regulator [Bradyrhizobium oligotrophicum S58]|uniref:TetR family transcriptional regulator n=1 Tax=Bradyrhizobium oligotrophicum S58 TaxID=1245469 RepID=M4ZB24_9BRAD|nr:TetR/AcrR family transcriptional regulator [Bradyrhizobium oligotrophicum]BAM90601.1 TetR family transcriptional regulator [Bradyrhizobium oligotrophicum S58]
MDNPSRSERSRKAALTAALTIIGRDGPGRLTLDAIARESGLSKGGLMHQFPNKEAVLKALLEQQFTHFDQFARKFRAELGEAVSQPELATQIAASRELIAQQYSVSQAMLGALAQEPALLEDARAKDAERVLEVRAEARDADLAVLRWAAARGLALMTMLRVSPLEQPDLDRLFARLLDDSQWTAFEQAGAPRDA